MCETPCPCWGHLGSKVKARKSLNVVVIWQCLSKGISKPDMIIMPNIDQMLQARLGIAGRHTDRQTDLKHLCPISFHLSHNKVLLNRGVFFHWEIDLSYDIILFFMSVMYRLFKMLFGDTDLLISYVWSDRHVRQYHCYLGSYIKHIVITFITWCSLFKM